MLVGTFQKNLKDFRLRNRYEGREIGRCLGGEYESGNVVEGLLARERRSLDILSVKKEAKESAFEVPGVVDGKGDEDFR